MGSRALRTIERLEEAGLLSRGHRPPVHWRDAYANIPTVPREGQLLLIPWADTDDADWEEAPDGRLLITIGDDDGTVDAHIVSVNARGIRVKMLASTRRWFSPNAARVA